jgi:hypothetical protein
LAATWVVEENPVLSIVVTKEGVGLYAEEGADLDDADRSGHFGDADVQDRAAGRD